MNNTWVQDLPASDRVALETFDILRPHNKQIELETKDSQLTNLMDSENTSKDTSIDEEKKLVSPFTL